ncbi:MAG TPA: hypothetical protein VFG29_08190 [Syntrophales bacterium]|nr:hypothetical protein [Syntrophales bacterium]
MHDPRKLMTFEFLGLCVVIFLAFCNVTVFYNLFNYLETLQIPADLRGLAIGSYSLTAMLLYLLVSPTLTPPTRCAPCCWESRLQSSAA